MNDRIKVGARVRVLKPDYAKGYLGIIEGYEWEFDRWIVRLEQNPRKDKDEFIRLSLEESNFVAIESHT